MCKNYIKELNIKTAENATLKIHSVRCISSGVI